MSNQILKTILFGAVLGAVLFWVPFFAVKILLFFMIFGLFFRFFKGRRYYGPTGWSYADKIRNMSEEEYTDFKANFRGGRCGHGDWKSDEKKTEAS